MGQIKRMSKKTRSKTHDLIHRGVVFMYRSHVYIVDELENDGLGSMWRVDRVVASRLKYKSGTKGKKGSYVRDRSVPKITVKPATVRKNWLGVQ